MGGMVEGKVVVVTGAGAGIGREFARAFASNGAKVIVNDVARIPGEDEFAANRVVKEVEQEGGEAAAVIESVAEWESAQRIVQAALDHFGRIDCVINNAGITRDRFFFNMSLEEWRTVLDVHLSGSFFTARAAAPHFKGQGSGCSASRASCARCTALRGGPRNRLPSTRFPPSSRVSLKMFHRWQSRPGTPSDIAQENL